MPRIPDKNVNFMVYSDTNILYGVAEVTLVLDNADHVLPVDFDEVAITRRMYRSGESEYYINREQVRLRDVNELLEDCAKYSVEGGLKVYVIFQLDKTLPPAQNKLLKTVEEPPEGGGSSLRHPSL